METGKKGVKAYERPSLRVIELAADEVLAVGCKTVSRTAAGNSAPPCMLNNCAQKGS
jgi:hypothetical protein